MTGSPLNPAEARVLQLAADGHRAARTAVVTGWGLETVRWHRKRAIGKLGTRNVTEAVAVSIRAGWIR